MFMHAQSGLACTAVVGKDGIWTNGSPSLGRGIQEGDPILVSPAPEREKGGRERGFRKEKRNFVRKRFFFIFGPLKYDF